MGCGSSSSASESVSGTGIQEVGGTGDVDKAVNLIQRGGMYSSLSNQLELHISCKGLPKLDTLSKSDPIAIVYLRKKNGSYEEVGRTEVVRDSLNPQFVKAIEITYFFEEIQDLKVEVYDVDDESHLSNLKAQEYIGAAEVHVHEIVREQTKSMEKPLENKKKYRGAVTISADQIDPQTRPSANLIRFGLEGRNIARGKRIFMKLFRSKEKDSEDFTPVFQTEIGRYANGRLIWKPISIEAHALIRDDPDRVIMIEVLEWKSSGDHKRVLCEKFSFKQLASQHETPITAPSLGEIVIQNIILEERHSFLDYIFGGCNISLFVAIDYTASNGTVSQPSSLHYQTPEGRNQYIDAIYSVGKILEAYDNDKYIGALGFGGQIRPFNQTSHCFALTGNTFAPETMGVDSIIDLYKRTLPLISLSGPTQFEEIIQYVANLATHQHTVNFQYYQNYYILLILTDGAIMDYQETVDQIVRSSGLPLSIVIVGVGDADFSSMEKLDADITPLKSRSGELMQRDIVQFVPFNEYKTNPQELARQTLGEIPKQLVDFMTHNQIKPFTPQQLMQNQINLPLIVNYYHIYQELFKKKVAETADFNMTNHIITTGIPSSNELLFYEIIQNWGMNYTKPL